MSKHSFMRKMGLGISSFALTSRKHLNATYFVLLVLLTIGAAISGVFSEINNSTYRKEPHSQTFSVANVHHCPVIIKSSNNYPHSNRTHSDHSTTVKESEDDDEVSNHITSSFVCGEQQQIEAQFSEKPQSRISFTRRIPLYIIFHSWKHFLH